MPKILYSAIGPDGKSVDGFVDASGAAQARAQLQARGLREVRFHQEASIGTDDAVLQGLTDAQADQLAARMVRIRTKPGLGTLLRETALANRWWLLIDVVLVPVLVWGGRYWTAAAIAAFGALPFVLALWAARRGNQYQALVKSDAVGDWARSAELIEALRPAAAANPTIALDLDVRAAVARVHQGEALPALLASLAPWLEKHPDQAAMYESRVAAVHAAAGDRAGMVARMRTAHEASNHEPARALDLALAEARFGDAAAAQTLLAGVDASLLPVFAAPFVDWTSGLVEQRAGNPDALGRLAKAVAGFLELSEKHPAVWTSLAFATADYALALQAAGRRDEARKTLKQVLPILKAHADAPLLQILQREVLAHPRND